MSNSASIPSKVRIEKVRLYTFDNVPIPQEYLVTEIQLSQSMNSAAFTGHIKIQDNIGNLEKYPLRGEERLELEITSNDTNTKKKLNLQIYRIDNIKINDASDGVFYYLHFISKTSFDASKKRVIAPIRNNSISQAAKDTFSKYYAKLKNNDAVSLPFDGQSYTVGNTTRNFIVQPTKDLFKGIIPNYTPADAMYFLSTRAYIRDAGFTSCSYRFFETIDDYYFVSDEYLIASAIRNNAEIILYYFPQVSKETEDMEQQVTSIKRLEYPVRVDSNLDLRSGGYASKITEINFMKREYKVKYFNYFGHDLRNSYDISGSEYIDSTGEKHTADTYIHTEEYARSTFNRENARQFMLFRDYGELGDIEGPLRGEQYMSEITMRRVSYQHHLQSTSLAVSLKGRLDIKPGSVIKLNVMEMTASSEKKINPQLSGNYLVHSTNHSIINEELTTNLNIMKYDWS